MQEKPTSNSLSSQGTYSPSQFMRSRRPELFSDSTINHRPDLNRDVFEYRLDVLTSNKQEIDFEHFCRRLAEVEICPNLIAQTGPTGGGDSKVDSETYPVAEKIAARWYIADPSSASSEKWAFAFSAKREWRSKVRSDVQGIADTKRGYKRIYFITNQFVKDKLRAQMESELQKKHEIPVHILDRSWILKCVFEHGRQDLAIETLHLDVPKSKSSVLGVRDTKRVQELEETEQRINDTSRYTGVEYQLVEDCLQAAILARNLERPRVEVDGHFARAQRLADSVGTPQQRLRVIYQHGWTAYWWYESYQDVLNAYELASPLALSSDLSDDVELLANLWQVLSVACDAGMLDRDVIQIREKGEELANALKVIAEDEERPNNALWAKTQILILDLLRNKNDFEKLERIIAGLTQVVESAEGLISYPLMSLVKLVEALGEFFAQFAAYDELVERLASATQDRVGRIQAGRILLARGYQKIRAGILYDAIRFFGRAQQQLALREGREELASALFVGGGAYEAVGLLWAARANTLASANQILADFREGGEIPRPALRAVQKLIWQELQIGRVPHVLLWLELASVIAIALGLDEESRLEFVEEREMQDKVLAMLFLKSTEVDLMALRFLPDVLLRMDLAYARMALLYALGYEDLLREEQSIPAEETAESLLETFTKFLQHSAAADLPDRPTGLESGAVTLSSPVLGVRIVVQADGDFESIRLGECILAASEALFATSLDAGLFPNIEELKISIVRASTHKGYPEVSDKLSGHDSLTICHNGDIARRGEGTNNWLLEILTKVLTTLVSVPQPDKYMKQIFGEEAGLGRALNFTESAVGMSNILGYRVVGSLSEWNSKGAPAAYLPKREGLWHGGKFGARADVYQSELKVGEGDIPEKLLNKQAKHTQRRVVSVIDLPLWEKAGWSGALYAVPMDFGSAPAIGLGFKDGSAGKKIFQGWLTRFGAGDAENRIRITIITGIDKKQPYSYRMVITSNLPSRDNGDQANQFVAVGRIHRMDPSSSINVDRFVACYRKVGSYVIIPAQFSTDGTQPQAFYDLAIQKSEMRIVQAWEIGEHDMDGMGIADDDDPIIPDNVIDAPVLRLLSSKRRRR